MFSKLVESGVEFNALMAEFKRKKIECVNNEIANIKKELHSLEKTLTEIRTELKSNTDNDFYLKWMKYVNGSRGFGKDFL